MIKLISSDMDGTLLNSYRQITPINIEAIKKAQENGINFIINTGGATAADVVKLMTRIEEKVKELFNVELKREIKLIGEF